MISPRINIYDTDQTTISNNVIDSNDKAFVPLWSKKHIGIKFASGAPVGTPGAAGEIYYDILNQAKYIGEKITIKTYKWNEGVACIVGTSAPTDPPTAADLICIDINNKKKYISKASGESSFVWGEGVDWIGETGTGIPTGTPVEADLHYVKTSPPSKEYTSIEDGETEGLKWVLSTWDDPLVPHTIVEFDTVDEFTVAVGDVPYNWNEGSNVAKDPDFDLNYIYAKELLNSGLPLFISVMNDYESDEITVAAPSTNKKFAPGTIKEVYAELADTGEYNFKFVTTGGYGLGSQSNNVVSFDDDYTKIEFTELEVKSIKDGTNYQFPFLTKDIITIRDDGTGYIQSVDYIAAVTKYRGDTIYLVDAIDVPAVSLNPADDNSFYNSVREKFRAFDDYSTKKQTEENDKIARSNRCLEVTFPYVDVECTTTKNVKGEWSSINKNKIDYILPGSFAYLKCLSIMLRNYENWLAVAGVQRAAIEGVKALHLSNRLSNAIADAYSPRNDIAVNCITDVKPYGYAIWGNRTLADNKYFADGGADGCIASSFLDIMVMVCDIKKELKKACKYFMFEKDDVALWTRFLMKVSPYLDKLVAGSGIKQYYINRLATTERAKIKAEVKIWPVYSVEAFDINVILTDSDVDVQ